MAKAKNVTAAKQLNVLSECNPELPVIFTCFHVCCLPVKERGLTKNRIRTLSVSSFITIIYQLLLTINYVTNIWKKER